MGFLAVAAKYLLKLAISLVMSVIGKLIVQSGVLEDIKERIEGYLPTLQEAWEGEDAEAFVQDVREKLIPELLNLIAAILGIKTALNKTIEHLKGTDDEAAVKGNNVTDAFDAARARLA